MKTKPLKLHPDKYMYIGCIPVDASPNHPEDQINCIIEDCPHCNKPMWVSENKRKLKTEMGSEAQTYCLECLVINANEQGWDCDLLNIEDDKCKTIQGNAESHESRVEEFIYEMYSGSKKISVIDETKISSSALRRMVQNTRQNVEDFDKREPKYLERWLKENGDKDGE